MDYQFSDTDGSFMPNDLYIACISNKSLEYYSNNEGSNFRNLLFQPLKLSSELHEVALVELGFSPGNSHSATIIPQPNIIPQPETKTPTGFWGDEPMQTFFDPAVVGDNIVRVSQLETLPTIFNKQDEVLSLFMARLVYDTTRYLRGVEVSSYYTGADDIEGLEEGQYTTIQFNDPENKYTLTISQNLADILGFEKLVMQRGINRSKFPQSQEALTKLSRSEELYMKMTFWINTNVKITEPMDFMLDSLFHHITDAMHQKNLEVRFVVPPSQDRVIVYLDESSLIVQLPVQINKYLGLKDDYRFLTSPTTVLLNSMVPKIKTIHQVKPVEKKVDGVEKVVGQSAHEKIMVLTNIAQSMYYGSECSPILRIFSSEMSTNRPIWKTFFPVYYFPVHGNDINFIHTQLVTQDFQEFPTEEDTVTTAIYHIRRKRR